MNVAETVDCSTVTTYPNFVELMPGWSTRIACQLPPKEDPFAFGWEAVTVWITIITSITAAIIALGSDRKALRRDRDSRALSSHENWISPFFKLGRTAKLAPSDSEFVLEQVKSATGSYSVHLMTRNMELATSFRSHARSIRQIHEIANLMFNTSKFELWTSSGCEKRAYRVFKDPTWYRRYRIYISECASALAQVHAGNSTDATAVERLDASDKRLRADFKDVFDLVEERLASHSAVQ